MRQSHLLAAHNPKLPHTPLLCQLPMAFWRRSTFKQGSLQLNSVFFQHLPQLFTPAVLVLVSAFVSCWKMRGQNHTVEVFTEKSSSMWRKTLKTPLNRNRMWNITQQKGKKNELVRHPCFSCQGDNIWLVSKTQSALTAASTPHPSSQPPVQHPPFSVDSLAPSLRDTQEKRPWERYSTTAVKDSSVVCSFFSVFQYTLPVWVWGRSFHWRSCG